MADNFVLLSGTANPDLGEAVAAELGVRLGACAIERFPDGKLSVRLDESVRRREVFLVQPTAPPVNDSLVELLAFADACRRSAAARFTAVVPYFGYARSDKRNGRREPILASLVARLMETAGVDHIVALDLHAAQIEGFFHTPVTELTAVSTLCGALQGRLSPGTVVVSPDAGRVAMATDYSQRLGIPVVIMHKRRASGTETEVTHVAGDVRGRPCLIIDDMISTGGTIARAVEALLTAGAQPEMTIAATHGLFVGGARANLGHEAVRRVIVTDSVAAGHPSWPLLRIVSVAPLLAAAIRRILTEGSPVARFQEASCELPAAPAAL